MQYVFSLCHPSSESFQTRCHAICLSFITISLPSPTESSRCPTMATLLCSMLSTRMKVMVLWLGKWRKLQMTKNKQKSHYFLITCCIQIGGCSRWGSELSDAAVALPLGRWRLQGFRAHDQRGGVPHGDAHRPQEGRPHRGGSSCHARWSCRCRTDVWGCFISGIWYYNSMFRSAMRTTKCWPPSLKISNSLKTLMPSSTWLTLPSR